MSATNLFTIHPIVVFFLSEPNQWADQPTAVILLPTPYGTDAFYHLIWCSVRVPHS